MSRRALRSAASSTRAASGTFGSLVPSGAGTSNFAATSSTLSYIAEPPDLSQISNPQLVVSFKNLLKKDSVTKAKALEEIQEYVTKPDTGDGGLEDGLLEAWVSLYPRTSIDSSRRVRQLAHILLGSIVLLCGKRIVKHLPKIVGAWLSGLYDNDRLVSRASQDSFIQCFPTEEKRRTLWTAYRPSILTYVEDATLHQTAQTLSDERTVTPDDAIAKHVRVAASGIYVLKTLIAERPAKEPEEVTENMNFLLKSQSLWDFGSHSDPFLRRSIHTLLRTCLRNESYILPLGVVSKAIISKSLHVSQLGSALDFSESLAALTELHPLVWTEYYSSKTPASKRLRQYLRKGSQGGPTQIWTNLASVLRHVPQAALCDDLTGSIHSSTIPLKEAESVLEALVEGITGKDEPRFNLATAWEMYIETTLWISGILDDVTEVNVFLETNLCPLVEKFLLPSSSTSQWAVHSPQAFKICTSCFQKIAASTSHSFLPGFWSGMSERLAESMKISLPEQSAGFHESQSAIASNASRWFAFEAEIISTQPPQGVMTSFSKSTLFLLELAIKLLESRNGKPYGCAAVIDATVANVPQLVFESQTGSNMITDLLKVGIPNMISSPSSDYLVSVLIVCDERDGYREGAAATMDVLLENTTYKVLPAFIKFLSLANLTSLSNLTRLTNRVLRDLNEALSQPISHPDTRWRLIVAFLNNRSIPSQIANKIFGIVSKELSSKNFEGALDGMDILVRECKRGAKEYATESGLSGLLSRLIVLSDSLNEDIARRSGALQVQIKALLLEHGGTDLATESSVKIIEANFRSVGKDSLPVHALFELARAVVGDCSPQERNGVVQKIFPSPLTWITNLKPFLEIVPNRALAVMSPFGGAIDAIISGPGAVPARNSQLYDSDHLSSALRLTVYVLRLMSLPDLLSVVTLAQQEATFLYFPLAIQIIDDNLTIEGASHAWQIDNDDIESEMADIVSEGRQLISEWIRGSVRSDSRQGGQGAADFVSIWYRQLENIAGQTPYAFHLGTAYSRILSEMVDMTGSCQYIGSWAEWSRRLRTTQDIFLGSAFLTPFKDLVASSADGRRLCNELIADLTSLAFDKQHQEGLRKLVFLNILSQSDDNLLEDVPKQRLVFLIKHLLAWLQDSVGSTNAADPSNPFGLVAEALKTVNSALPIIQDVYGSHWKDVMLVLEKNGTDLLALDDALQLTQAMIRLIFTLRNLAREESNDDLREEWEVWSKEQMPRLLMHVLEGFRDSKWHSNLPRRIVTDALARLVTSTEFLRDIDEVCRSYGLLRVESSGVQKAASDIISRSLPTIQENVSIRVGASGETARLPDELLSLLLEPPNLDHQVRGHSDERQWLNIRGYLLSWRALFEHFDYSSHKVITDYTEGLKEGTQLSELLQFIFDFLGHATGKPIDASKFDVTNYAIDGQETSEKDIQWLCIYLYYLCLVHLPTITKAWWIDSKKRVKAPIESWTQKFISPHVISSALNTVSEWEKEEIPGQDQHPLEIKIAPKASELTASIVVDEGGDSPPISITINLPPTYPLQPALVMGRHRVAVDEKKWRSWLLTIQGVIMFHGNLADGLMAFRRNVQGALKGQGECAICYSVISSDMQTPNKKCGTCKNMFHSSCLFRWFKSSNSSSCPLCRNSFNYG